ncbi:unnamed protein product, partial [Mesorhabditis belari]|uniref:Mitochondrial carrier n=1 Tax=Mesorhabditis belari TaxID=2138241 RepID=A0AAF3J4V7_9BILA
MAQIFPLTEEDKKYYRALLTRSALSGIFYPFTTARTLIQLGHSPFTISTSPIFFSLGFEWKAIRYAKQLAYAKGVWALWSGFEPFALSSIVSGVASYSFGKYLNTHYPDVGGPVDFNGKEERSLTDHESFRRTLRSAIRSSIVQAFSLACSRALTVVHIRQVAQIVSGETKYHSALQALQLVGIEEGPIGFFRGLAMQIIGELVMIWGFHSVVYLTERLLVRSGLAAKAVEDKRKQEVWRKQRLPSFPSQAL